MSVPTSDGRKMDTISDLTSGGKPRASEGGTPRTEALYEKHYLKPEESYVEDHAEMTALARQLERELAAFQALYKAEGAKDVEAAILGMRQEAAPSATATTWNSVDVALEYETRTADPDLTFINAAPMPKHATGWRLHGVPVPVAPMGFSHSQAVCILKVRDALLAKDIDEAWHWLYTLDSKQTPHDPFKPWATTESIAAASTRTAQEGK